MAGSVRFIVHPNSVGDRGMKSLRSGFRLKGWSPAVFQNDVR